jgi:hypothetical protein
MNNTIFIIASRVYSHQYDVSLMFYIDFGDFLQSPHLFGI